jgi:hypothetical protein
MKVLLFLSPKFRFYMVLRGIGLTSNLVTTAFNVQLKLAIHRYLDNDGFQIF